MCGITALLLKTSTSLPAHLKNSIHRLQHRGYDGAGIALDQSNGEIILKKGKGLIQDVLHADLIKQLEKDVSYLPYGIAHTRYKTVGECTNGSSQPLLRRGRFCLVHNGQVETDQCLPDTIHILNIIEQMLSNDQELTEERIFNAIKYVLKYVKGSFSCVLMIHNFGLVVFRDIHGIRPLIYAQSTTGNYGVASEDIALTALFPKTTSPYRDIKPGECLIMRPDQKTPRGRVFASATPCFNPCIFEYIYLAHPDSVINGIPVKLARKRLGQMLARRIKASDYDLDYIIPIPETSCIAAQEMAQILDVTYLKDTLTLRQDRAKARTFILPTQEERVKAVSHKFEIRPDDHLQELLKDKHILLVDDSIIRGTTLNYVIQLFKERTQVAKVSVASISPPVRYKNIYGIDIPNTNALIAIQPRTEQDIARILGADRVFYQNYLTMMEGFKKLSQERPTQPPIKSFESSLFTGFYIL